MREVGSRLLGSTLARVDATGVAAAAASAAAVALRFPRVLNDPFWQDEVASARILREPSIGAMLARVSHTESTPPLWYTLGWIMHRLGVALVDVRLLSVACGGMLVLLVVRFASTLIPPPAAILAGVLVALGGHFAFADRTLRAYALLALLPLVFAFALDRLLVRAGRRELTLLAAATAAGALTHYFFLFTIAAGCCWLWLEPAARTVRRRGTAAIACGGAFAAPWLPWSLHQYRQHRYFWIGSFDVREVVATPLRIFTPLIHLGWVPVVFLVVVAVGALRLGRRSARGRLCAALALGPLLLAAAVWWVGVDIYATRNMLEIGGFIAICTGSALTAPGRRTGAILVAAAGVAAAVSFAVAQQPSTQYDAIAGALVTDGWRGGDSVAVFGSPYAFHSPLEWYLPARPELTIMREAGSCCRRRFVIVNRSSAASFASALRDPRQVGSFVVARVRGGAVLRARWWLGTPDYGCAGGVARSAAVASSLR